MDRGFVDLHVHSTASDGTLTPTQVVWEAARMGLAAFALTDHDTVRGIREAREAVLRLGREGMRRGENGSKAWDAGEPEGGASSAAAQGRSISEAWMSGGGASSAAAQGRDTLKGSVPEVREPEDGVSSAATQERSVSEAWMSEGGVSSAAALEGSTLKGSAPEVRETVGRMPSASASPGSALGAGGVPELIPGIEISVSYLGKDVHILGLLIDETCPELLGAMDEMVARRERRNERMAENLRGAGLPISMGELREVFPGAVLTRAHFAKLLLAKGAVGSMKEAFDQYLDPSGPYYVQREYLTPEEAIRLIRAAGGVPVLAHPLLYRFPEATLNRMIASMREAGLLGLEAIHSTNVSNDESYLRGLARRYGLAISGGSDFHGSVKPGISLGVGRGGLRVPYEVLEGLRERKRQAAV